MLEIRETWSTLYQRTFSHKNGLRLRNVNTVTYPGITVQPAGRARIQWLIILAQLLSLNDVDAGEEDNTHWRWIDTHLRVAKWQKIWADYNNPM